MISRTDHEHGTHQVFDTGDVTIARVMKGMEQKPHSPISIDLVEGWIAVIVADQEPTRHSIDVDDQRFMTRTVIVLLPAI
jgi:hypothetical protein